MKNRILEALWFPVNEDNLHLRSEQIRVRLRSYMSMIGGQGILLAIFDSIMWNVQPRAALLMYNAVWVLVATIEVVWWWQNRDRVNSIQECTRWHIVFNTFTGAFALFWGAAAIWLFPADLIHQVLLLMLLLGLAAASVSTNTVYQSTFYIWIIGVLVPPIVHFAIVGDGVHWSIAGFATLYFAVLIKSGGEVSAVFLDALGQRIDKERVIEQLLEQQDIANQARSNAESLARIDHLTGLYNRRAFYEIAGPLWSAALRSNRDISVILLDIDHFKMINDNYGHTFGDKVLESVASILRASAREADVVARWGGEEFILILPETNLEAAMTLAERLRASISTMRIDYEHKALSITASFGVVQRAGTCLSIDELTSRADKCLYQAKAEGRNRVSDRSAAASIEALGS
jgi:diguanylate cyclase (GGDEF)-like protein